MTLLPRRFENAGDEPLPLAEKLAWIRLSRTGSIGPITFFHLMDRYKTASRALEHLPHLARRGGKAPVIPPIAAVEREYEAVRKRGGDILAACEPGYPIALTALEDAPPVLTVFGSLRAVAKQPCVAIVGARNASLNARKFAQSLAQDLGVAGQLVVSGMARGIDTAAHLGALNTGTIAVVAGGADIVYPEENRDLYEKIIRQGAVVAENPLGFHPRPQDFPRRNRIVSGLSAGVVVVEASLRSGSLITARLAAEQGRDVFAVPGFPMDPRAQGANALIRDGAVLVQSAADILGHLNAFTGGRALSESPRGTWAADLFSVPDSDAAFGEMAAEETEEDDVQAVEDAGEILLSRLSFSAVEVDELIRSCQLSVPAAQTALLELELSGRLRRLPGNRVSLAE